MSKRFTAKEWAQHSSAEHDEMIHRAAFEKDLAARIGVTLMRVYPGYEWHVEVESRAGMVHVRNLSLNGNWGYDVHLRTVQNDFELKSCVMAAGEILERYGVSRECRVAGEVEALPRDLRGDAIGDHSAAA